MWKKGLILGIIILFLGVCVLPSACGKLVKQNTNDDNFKKLTMKVTFIVIGLIFNKTKIGNNDYYFKVLIGFIAEFDDGKFSAATPMIDWPIGFAYSSKIGIFSEHVVCAVFFNCYFPYAS